MRIQVTIIQISAMQIHCFTLEWRKHGENRCNVLASLSGVKFAKKKNLFKFKFLTEVPVLDLANHNAQISDLSQNFSDEKFFLKNSRPAAIKRAAFISKLRPHKKASVFACTCSSDIWGESGSSVVPLPQSVPFTSSVTTELQPLISVPLCSVLSHWWKTVLYNNPLGSDSTRRVLNNCVINKAVLLECC